MWYDESVLYQIYPLGLCGAPRDNDGVCSPRIRMLESWMPYIANLGMTGVLFNPLFESDRHGYDTRDFQKVDCRLGTNEDFAAVSAAAHENGLKVLLDGVFNHVGRGFWAFQDVLKNRESSAYKDWFNVNFYGNSNYNDGLWYEGWEGHYELVKLNLHNNDVVEYLFDSIRKWVEWFDIDGLRLDVAYCIDEGFLRRLRAFTAELKPDFVLVGEMLHGDYNRLVNDAILHSCTNYECYKGLYSAFNSGNLFEIGHSIQRQFGPELWTLYRGKHLLNFVDNHDVTRIMTILEDKKQIFPLYGLLFGMPGVPCIYYGSEWGAEGDKHHGDDALRAAFDKPVENELSEWVAALAKARTQSPALCSGSYRTVLLTSYQYIFERELNGERVLVAINAAAEPYVAHFNANAGRATELITGKLHDFGGGSELAPYSAAFWRTE